MDPQQLPKTSKFYSRSKKCDIEKTLGGGYHPPLVARRLTRQSTTALPVKDLPKVPTWRLEFDLNMQPFGRKASNLPLSYHAPHDIFMDNGALGIIGYILRSACVCVKVEINSYWNVCLTL